jgi:pseudoazurin
MRKVLAFSLVICAAGYSQLAYAEDVTVQVLNRDPKTNVSFLFKPGVVRVKAGDTVRWVSTNTMHNVAFVPGGIPFGIPQFTSGFQTLITYKFTKPGAYLYKCGPHFGLGMIGLVVVGGDLNNLNAIKSLNLPMPAKQRLSPLLSEAVRTP